MEILKHRNDDARLAEQGKRERVALCSLAFFLAFAVSAAAQEAPQAKDETADREIRLSLAECVQLALRNNPIILIEKAKGPIENNLKVMKIIYEVYETYWDLVSEREKLNSSQKINENATRLLESVRIRVSTGELAPMESNRFDLEAANTKAEMSVIESATQRHSDNLLRLTNATSGKDMWQKVIVATDRPTVSEEAMDVEQAIKEAFENRPDYLDAKQKAEEAGSNEDRLALQSIEQELITKIRELARQITITTLEVHAAQKAKDFAQKVLKSEERKMAVGKATTLIVIGAESELSAVEAREIEALARHRKTLAAMELAKGTILRLSKEAVAPGRE